jgi:hypothetical protein
LFTSIRNCFRNRQATHAGLLYDCGFREGASAVLMSWQRSATSGSGSLSGKEKWLKKKGAAIENERLSSDEWSDIAGGLSEVADR